MDYQISFFLTEHESALSFIALSVIEFHLFKLLLICDWKILICLLWISLAVSDIEH